MLGLNRFTAFVKVRKIFKDLWRYFLIRNAGRLGVDWIHCMEPGKKNTSKFINGS